MSTPMTQLVKGLIWTDWTELIMTDKKGGLQLWNFPKISKADAKVQSSAEIIIMQISCFSSYPVTECRMSSR